MKDTPSTPSGYGATPGRASRFSRWRGGLIALTSLVTLTAVGCGGPSSSSPNGSPQGNGRPAAGSGQPGQSAVSPGAAGSRSGGSGRTATWHLHASRPEASGVVGGALFGGDMPLTFETGKLRRNLAVVRVYFRIGERFSPYAYEGLLKRGSTLLVSLDATPRMGVTYAAIVAGRYDAQIRNFLENVNMAAVTHHLGAIYICFEHEADSPAHARLGSPAEFIRAWDHIHALAAAAHLNWQQGGRLHWVMILLREAYTPAAMQPRWARREGVASQYWPGNHEVDIVAADGYNAGNCRSTHVPHYAAPGTQVTSPATLFGPLVSFAQAHGNLPVFISEWGTVPYRVSTVAPDYIRQMQQFVTANHEIAAALYWDARGTNSCDYILNQQPTALSALAAMGHSPRLQGHVS